MKVRKSWLELPLISDRITATDPPLVIDTKRAKRKLTTADMLRGTGTQRVKEALLPVLQKYGITYEELKLGSRRKMFIYARKEACYRLHQAGMSYCAIGRIFGHDHTTIMYAVSSWDEKTATDSRLYGIDVVRDAFVRKYNSHHANSSIRFVIRSSVNT